MNLKGDHLMIATILCYMWPLLVPFLLACEIRSLTNSFPDTGRAVKFAASMTVARSGHTATSLLDGRVLITGGMNGNGSYFAGLETYDPTTNRFNQAPDMSERRVGHSATLLADGKVLIAGGYNGEYLQSAELFDPATGRTSPTGKLTAARSEHIAVLLSTGKVLLVGGVGTGYTFLATSELYDPTTGTFTASGSMMTPREGHTATLLKNGKVLVTGGHKDRREAMTVFSSAELYDPSTAKFTRTGEMTTVRHKQAAVLLADGNVLVIGGADKRDWKGQYASAEIYDVASGSFKAIADMNVQRFKLASAVVPLKDGTILIAGGADRLETYDPATKTFRLVAGQLDTARFFSSATLLQSGNVLVAGGYDDHGMASARAWLYEN
jgi:Kelch motif protein/galactose oxidase-like protein